MVRFGPGNLFSNQVQFASVQQFPLDGFTGFQSDGRGQGQRNVDIKSRLLAFGTNRLHFQ